MARRRTIGDNPLDSISTPRQPEDPPAAKTPPAPATTMPVQAGPASHAYTTSAPGGAAPGMLRFLRRSRIRILGGDAAPGETRLSPPYPGQARGFALAKDDYVILKHDVVRLEVESEQSIRRPSHLLGWAAVGAFVAGPLGALVGGLYGGRERALAVFEMRLTDGRTIKAATHPSTLADMQAELGPQLSRG